jgi:type I restriction enzyme S subunit
LISLRKQQLAKLDELVKARFVEMFGDPSNNPMGWKKQNFEDIALLITDGEHMTPQRTNKGIYLLSARNILNHTIQLDDVDYIDEEEYGRIARRIVPQQGDVLVSCSGSIGRCCVVPSELKFQMVRSVALIRFNNTINPIFAKWLIATDELQKQIYTSATQSSQANLFQGKIRKLCGYVPPLSLQNQFAAFVERVDKQKQTVQQSLEKLELLKKALMQEYFG